MSFANILKLKMQGSCLLAMMEQSVEGVKRFCQTVK